MKKVLRIQRIQKRTNKMYGRYALIWPYRGLDVFSLIVCVVVLFEKREIKGQVKSVAVTVCVVESFALSIFFSGALSNRTLKTDCVCPAQCFKCFFFSSISWKSSSKSSN